MISYSMVPPLKPTLARYVDVFWRRSDVSIYRALQNEALERLEYRGRVLDFGGGRRAHYHDDFASWLVDGVYESANIDQSMQPTYLVSPGGQLPVASGTFDMVISINTLEHVYDIDTALDEMLRVLRPGGRMVISVPFLFRVHGCPDDYNRPTASWWRETLSRKRVSSLRVTPLVWDGLSTGIAVIDGLGPLTKLRRVTVPLLGVLYGWLKSDRSAERYPAAVGDSLANVALGYVLEVEVPR